MEFGILISSPVPSHVRSSSDNAEHAVFMRDIETAIAADQAGFKYIWASENHFLDEYSHLSANHVMLAYLARATTRAHLGSGTFNSLPAVNHPAKLTETVAMLDHLSEGRFEFGTGRGTGSHEVLGFMPDLPDLNETKEMWADVLSEIPKMFLQDEYEGYQGKYWSMPPRKILPKPFKAPHPPLWYAAGNIASYEMAGRMGLGVLGFSVQAVDQLEPILRSYKAAVKHAEPVGAFVNDNLAVMAAGVCAESREDAYRTFLAGNPAYHTSLIFRYHDTSPRPAGVPPWPEVAPEMTVDDVKSSVARGALLGDPDDVIAACRRWEGAGVDQLIIELASPTLEDSLTTVRLFGDYVIPKFDTDPVHRTTRFRDAATDAR